MEPLLLLSNCFIRTMSQDDVPAVRQIEQSVHITPWSIKGFLSSMEAGYGCWVAEHPQFGIIGYLVFMVVVDVELHLLNIAIHPRFHRQGVGAWLLESLLQHARRLNVDAVVLEVRVSNEGARRLYEKYHFHQVGIRKNYYRTASGREDALFLQRSLGIPV